MGCCPRCVRLSAAHSAKSGRGGDGLRVCVCVCVNFLTPLVFLEDRVKMATKKRERLNLYSLYGHKEGFGLRLLEVFGGYLNLDRLGVVGLFD